MKQIIPVKKNPYTLSFFGFLIILLPLGLFFFAPEKGSAGTSWKIPTHAESNYRIPRELSFEEYEKEYKKTFTPKQEEDEEEGKKDFWKKCFGNVPLTEEEYNERQERTIHDLLTYEQGGTRVFYHTGDPAFDNFLPTLVQGLSPQEAIERVRIAQSISPEQKKSILKNTREISEARNKMNFLNLKNDINTLMPLGERSIPIIIQFCNLCLGANNNNSIPIFLFSVFSPWVARGFGLYNIQNDDNWLGKNISRIIQNVEGSAKEHANMYAGLRLVIFFVEWLFIPVNIGMIWNSRNGLFHDPSINDRAQSITNFCGHWFIVGSVVLVAFIASVYVLLPCVPRYFLGTGKQDATVGEEATAVEEVKRQAISCIAGSLITILFFLFPKYDGSSLSAKDGNLKKTIWFLLSFFGWDGMTSIANIAYFLYNFYNYSLLANNMDVSVNALYEVYNMMKLVDPSNDPQKESSLPIGRFVTGTSRLKILFEDKYQNDNVHYAFSYMWSWVCWPIELIYRAKWFESFESVQDWFQSWDLSFLLYIIYESNQHDILRLLTENKEGGIEFKKALADLHWLHYVASDRRKSGTTPIKTILKKRAKRRPIIRFFNTKALPNASSEEEEKGTMNGNLMLGNRPVSLLLASRRNFVPAIQEAYQMTLFAQATGLAPCVGNAQMSVIDKICYINGLQEKNDERLRGLINYAQTNPDKKVLLFATDLENFAGEDGAEVLYAYIKWIKDCQNITAYIGSSSYSISKYLEKDSDVDRLSISLAGDGGASTVAPKALDHSILKEAFQGQEINPTVQKNIGSLLRNSKKEFAGLPVNYGLSPFSGNMTPIILLALLLLMLALLDLRRRGRTFLPEKG